MSSDAERLVDEYLAWLRSRITVQSVGDWSEITTPFLDRHNDCIQIYVRRSGNELVLTDGGTTIAELEMSGCDVRRGHRKELLDGVLTGLGVQFEDDALIVRASGARVAQKKHDLIQAIISVNDLFFTAQPHAASIFLEEVDEWLHASEIRPVRDVKLTGHSGFDHSFHFVVPGSRTAPERLLKAFNRPSRAAVEAFAFAWVDTRERREQRAPAAKAYAILNDEGRDIAGDVLEGFRSYDITPVPWSERDEVRRELAA
jgi:hypothetical protein